MEISDTFRQQVVPWNGISVAGWTARINGGLFSSWRSETFMNVLSWWITQMIL